MCVFLALPGRSSTANKRHARAAIEGADESQRRQHRRVDCRVGFGEVFTSCIGTVAQEYCLFSVALHNTRQWQLFALTGLGVPHLVSSEIKYSATQPPTRIVRAQSTKRLWSLNTRFCIPSNYCTSRRCHRHRRRSHHHRHFPCPACYVYAFWSFDHLKRTYSKFSVVPQRELLRCRCR